MNAANSLVCRKGLAYASPFFYAGPLMETCERMKKNL